MAVLQFDCCCARGRAHAGNTVCDFENTPQEFHASVFYEAVIAMQQSAVPACLLILRPVFLF
jgi:hypothetical protein